MPILFFALTWASSVGLSVNFQTLDDKPEANSSDTHAGQNRFEFLMRGVFDWSTYPSWPALENYHSPARPPWRFAVPLHRRPSVRPRDPLGQATNAENRPARPWGLNSWASDQDDCTANPESFSIFCTSWSTFFWSGVGHGCLLILPHHDGRSWWKLAFWEVKWGHNHVTLHTVEYGWSWHMSYVPIIVMVVPWVW